MRSAGAMFIGGALGLVALKMAVSFVGPLFVMLLGFLLMALKVMAFLAVVYFLISLFRKKKEAAQEVG